MVNYRKKQDAYDLQRFGARLEIEIGPPILRTSVGAVSPGAALAGGKRRFYKLPALLDTGAARTVVTPLVITTVGLPKIDVTRLARAGGVTEDAGVYVAAIQFPRYKLATIEVVEVISCELPEQPIQCLLGRDILARWVFTYNGPPSIWSVEEEDVGAWVAPPEGIDT